MDTDNLFSVTITPEENPSEGLEAFEISFVGPPEEGGEEAQRSITGQVRKLNFNESTVFLIVDGLEFVNIPEEDQVQLALMVPRGLIKLWGIHAGTYVLFAQEITEAMPYLYEATQELAIPDGARIVTTSFVNQADAALVNKGYHFQLAPPVTEVVDEVVEEIETVAASIPPAPAQESTVTVDVTELVEAEGPVFKLKVNYSGDEYQFMAVGSNPAALGRALTVDYRHKTQVNKMEVAAVDVLQAVGIERSDALALAYGILQTTNRYNPELPMELGLTKGAHEVLSAEIPELTDRAKWSSHLNLFVLDSDYTREEITRVAALGYVIDLEE